MMINLSNYALGHIVLALEMSHLANFFAVLILLSMGTLLFLVKNYALPKSFYALSALLSTSLFLIVYAADYLLFFIGWEVMSITTYFLLSFSVSQKTLHKYIIFAMSSALALFIAILMIYSTQQSFLYSDARESFELMGEFQGVFFLVLILFAIFVKLGVIGFHYWLVDAYEEAHDIFTAFLSAVLSKMGVYALIILVVKVTQPMLALAIIGVMTSIIATFKAIQEDSVKRVLAYSSIAQLGYIVTVLGVADGMSGALYHSLIHTAVKLLLFINIAGVIYMTGRDKFSQLGGLIYKMPQSFVLLLIGIIVLAGMPPLGGFSSKFLIYSALLDTKYLLLLSGVMFSSASAFLYIYKLIYGVYLGHPSHKKLESAKEVSLSFLLPQYLLAFILITLGTFPALIVPYINEILLESSLTTLSFTHAGELISAFAQFNGLIVMSAFGTIFVLVVIFFVSTRSKAKEAKNRFDIAYCGEEPDESTHLHYGYSMGKELARVGILRAIIKNSSSHFYEYLGKQTLSFAELFRKIYSGKLSVNFNIAILFLLLLLWGSLR